MRDSLGGSVVIVIIVVFIVIVMGYLAFNVNYTKAFRMKNKIISVYKEYNGDCDSSCEKDIEDYAQKIGYKPSNNIVCPSFSTSHATEESNTLYCSWRVVVNTATTTDGHVDSNEKFYYHIVTKINIEIPIISNIFNLQVFNITGDTSVFEKE